MASSDFDPNSDIDHAALLAPIDQAAMLCAAQEWSAVNSGTSNLEGLARQAAMLVEAFSALPGEISLVAGAEVSGIDESGNEVPRPFGEHLILSVRPRANRRVLLTGHMDTVFPADHPFQTRKWLDDETLNGPGLADMKGGIAVILHALMAFEASPYASALGYDVLINADEETGSLSSAPLIAQLAEGKIAALTYEPSALPDGTLAHARGGSGNYSLIFKGRSAHAGRNPQDGRNAVVAAARCAAALADYTKEDIAVNPARIAGGSANNVVPDLAILHFNIRPKTPIAGDEFEIYLKSLISNIENEYEVSIVPHGGVTRPPKPVDAKAQKLFDLVRDCGAALGQKIGWQSSGGVCDGNNIAACGVPVVDTMGVRGGAIHSADEFMIVPSLSERAALSALVLARLARGEEL